jgi:hypothetical protein
MRAKGAPTHLHVLPPKNSDSYKTYATKSPKITIFALKEKSTKGFSTYLYW